MVPRQEVNRVVHGNSNADCECTDAGESQHLSRHDQQSSSCQQRQQVGDNRDEPEPQRAKGECHHHENQHAGRPQARGQIGDDLVQLTVPHDGFARDLTCESWVFAFQILQTSSHAFENGRVFGQPDILHAHGHDRATLSFVQDDIPQGRRYQVQQRHLFRQVGIGWRKRGDHVANGKRML